MAIKVNNITVIDDSRKLANVSNYNSTGNTFFSGSFAGANNATGFNNNFLGASAGVYNTSGSDNNFFGFSSGYCNTSGTDNTFIGNCAGNKNTTGCFNTFIGKNAGLNNTTGTRNFFVGTNAGCSNTTGTDNVFLGSSSGSSGCNNFFVGNLSGNNTVGNNNIAVGFWALQANYSGGDNIAMGYFAGLKITTGFGNRFFGYSSGKNTTTGYENTFMGSCAGYSNTVGLFNTFLGNAAGERNILGCDNIAIGQSALRRNSTITTLGTITGGTGYTDGTYTNVTLTWAGGEDPLVYPKADITVSGGSVTAVTLVSTGAGIISGVSFTAPAASIGGTGSGFRVSATGYDSGSDNIVMGFCAGFNNTVGSNNHFFGNKSGFNNTTGYSNLFFGKNSGTNNTIGFCNNFIGENAGCSNTTGNNNVFLGTSAGAGTIGLADITTESNRIIIGNCNHTCAQIQVAWTTVSDIRDKCVFGAVTKGRGFLQNIKPIEFAFRDRNSGCLLDPPGKKRYGFSAQNILEVEGSEPVVVSTENPDKLQITNDYLVPILVNAVNELSQELETLKQRMNLVENRTQ